MKTIHHFKDLYLIAIEAMDAVYYMQEKVLTYRQKHGETEELRETIQRLDSITKLLDAYTSLVAVYESLRIDNQIKDKRYLELANEFNEFKKNLDISI